jgi:hypothetical protein
VLAAAAVAVAGSSWCLSVDKATAFEDWRVCKGFAPENGWNEPTWPAKRCVSVSFLLFGKALEPYAEIVMNETVRQLLHSRAATPRSQTHLLSTRITMPARRRYRCKPRCHERWRPAACRLSHEERVLTVELG